MFYMAVWEQMSGRYAAVFSHIVWLIDSLPTHEAFQLWISDQK